ncbi:hypothetical protein [Psychrobacillus antarcticus]|uniref:hypothetical protein n=1 Tax=Psychrobacillus antarcticus TaxID=2879115 RepID=UPI002408194F|nr:hypothetical protein [Psychrobacillus antarcticus]
MSYYYERTVDFENLSYEKTVYFFQKVTKCYLEQVFTLSNSNPNVTNMNRKNIDKIIALSRMLNKNYEMFKLDAESDTGFLLQSWISIGAVLEGCLQSFLKIYYYSYDNQPVRNTKGKKIKIEELKSYQLVEYFFSGDGIIQNGEFDKNNIDNIRVQRNLVHFFVGETIATWDNLNVSIKMVIEILLDLISRLPELEDENGSVSLCDENLYSEVYKMKHQWFLLKSI